MPPKSMKTVARRPKLPIRRTVVQSSPSPSPPARKRRAATTPEARARKLQKEGIIPSVSKPTKVTRQSMSSSSSASPGDQMASTSSPESPDTSDNNSPINEGNVYDKIEKMAGGEVPDEAIHEGVHVVGQNEDSDEQEERGQAETAQEQQEQGRVDLEEDEENQSMETTKWTPSVSKKRKPPTAPRQGIRDLPLTYFQNEESKIKFYKGFHSRPVHVPRPIDFDFLEEHKFNLETMITMQGWKQFLRRADPIYHELVLLLHWNWDFKTFSSIVKGTRIELGSTSAEAEARLGRILKIPHQEDSELPTTATLFNTLSNSAKYSEGHSVMKTNELSIPNRVLRQFLRHYLLPKQGGTDTVTVLEAQLIWKLSLMRQISIPKLMLQSLAHFRGRVNLLVPYGMWWTRVFRRYKVDLTGELYKEMSLHERDFIGSTMIRRMHIDAATYKAEMEAKEQADMAGNEDQPAEGSGGQVPSRVEPGSEAQNASPRWYPGSWYDRIQGGDSWIPWDGAKSNFETQASAHSHHAPQPVPPPQPQPSSHPPDTINVGEVSQRHLTTTLSAMQSSMLAQFNAVHTTLARIDNRLNILSERQAALERNQHTLSAQLASLVPSQPSSSHPSDPPVPPTQQPPPS